MDVTTIAQGLAESRTVLAALNRIAEEGLVLNAGETTLADLHLAPMICYFVKASEGANELHNHVALTNWWKRASQQKSLIETDPGLPSDGD